MENMPCAHVMWDDRILLKKGWRIKSHFARGCYECLDEQVGHSSTSTQPIKSFINPKLSHLVAWMFQLWLVGAYFFVVVVT
jgi:hypothetical protein